MPLLDHFRPPLAPSRKWESFHAFWSTALGERLNSRLPRRYFAETQIHIGTRIEVDIATMETDEFVNEPMGNGASQEASASGDGGGVAVALQTYAPPVASAEIPAVFPDDIEVQIFYSSGGNNLVGAIELVSPGNKDRPETRRAFAAKCAAYLQRGVGLVVVDIVTERQANLHDELMELLEQPQRFPGTAALYAVAYRPVHREATGNHIEIWTLLLELGSALPTLPLWLRRGPVVPVELDATYEEAKKRGRL